MRQLACTSFLLLIVTLRFTGGESQICSTIKKSQNIMNMIVGPFIQKSIKFPRFLKIWFFFQYQLLKILRMKHQPSVQEKKGEALHAQHTAWKVSKYGIFSTPYFPAFGLNTGKYGSKKTPYFDTFHAVAASKKLLGLN